MADYGAVGKVIISLNTFRYGLMRKLTPVYMPRDQWLTINNYGKLSGQVSKDGVPQAHVNVMVFSKIRDDNPVLSLLARTRTNDSGDFEFKSSSLNCLVMDQTFLVIAFDPSSSPNFNALIYDKINPVSE